MFLGFVLWQPQVIDNVIANFLVLQRAVNLTVLPQLQKLVLLFFFPSHVSDALKVFDNSATHIPWSQFHWRALEHRGVIQHKNTSPFNTLRCSGENQVEAKPETFVTECYPTDANDTALWHENHSPRKAPLCWQKWRKLLALVITRIAPTGYQKHHAIRLPFDNSYIDKNLAFDTRAEGGNLQPWKSTGLHFRPAPYCVVRYVIPASVRHVVRGNLCSQPEIQHKYSALLTQMVWHLCTFGCPDL